MLFLNLSALSGFEVIFCCLEILKCITYNMFNSQNYMFVPFRDAYSLKKESRWSRKNGEGGNFLFCLFIFSTLRGD